MNLMNTLVLFFYIVSFLGAFSSTASCNSNSEVPEATGTACNETKSQNLASPQDTGLKTKNCSDLVQTKKINITSDS
jgi:hypothetical protein